MDSVLGLVALACGLIVGLGAMGASVGIGMMGGKFLAFLIGVAIALLFAFANPFVVVA
jgi:F-type H+-transporting ATPase subunit c